MIRFTIAAALLYMAISASQAQTDSLTRPALQYAGEFSFGLTFKDDADDHYFTATTAHGVKLNRWFAGLGVGYDDFERWYTVPFFATVSYEFARIKRSAFLVQAMGGYGQAWSSSENEGIDIETRGGRAYGAMLGYRYQATQRISVRIISGYRFQRIKYFYDAGSLRADAIWLPQSWEVKRDMERVFVTLGMGF